MSLNNFWKKAYLDEERRPKQMREFEHLKILPTELLPAFLKLVNFNPLDQLNEKSKEQLPVDYFQFYNSISSVYSSKIEGEDIDFDSFYKHKFLNVKYLPDYTKRSDDLFAAYEFIYDHELNEVNVLKVHEVLSQHLLPKGQRGLIRNNPMFVINEEDRIEYVACDAHQLKTELSALFADIDQLKKANLDTVPIFYFAAMIHLVFVKIHPMQDGNGRTARLMEKWFLVNLIGKNASAVELEKNYFVHRKEYYQNIRKLGLEYGQLDYFQALDFLVMTVNSLK